MSYYILDKSYKCSAGGPGIKQATVAVQGGGDGECSTPLSANAPAILGVTTGNQPHPYQPVTVRKAGIAQVVAAGHIRAGSPVNIAGTDGKVKAIDEPSGIVINCLGFAETTSIKNGDIIKVFISLHERIAP